MDEKEKEKKDPEATKPEEKTAETPVEKPEDKAEPKPEEKAEPPKAEDKADVTGGFDMRYPKLVPDRVCVTPCTVYQTDGLNRDGSKKETVIFKGKCFHSEKATQKLNAEKQLITLSGAVLFNGDISPDSPVIDGYVKLNERDYKIYSSEKAKNPDGTVNFTRLELI